MPPARISFCLFFALLAQPAAAQTAAPTPAPEQIRPQDVYAYASANWAGDYQADRAMLLRGAEPDMLDLLITVTPDDRETKPIQYFYPQFVWIGQMAGQEAGLAINKQGSLEVTALNESIGRNRWEETSTLSFRDEKPVLAGYSYIDRDTLDPEAGTNCDVNLLSGKRILNGKTDKVELRAIDPTGWTDAVKAGLCQLPR